MGILTNPTNPQKSKWVKQVITYRTTFTNILFLCGVLWFTLLSDVSFNHGTYFSENALLPGLVYSEIKRDTVNLASTWSQELQREREQHTNGLPYSWLLAKMRQIGLETHTQNFTLNYPFGGGKKFTGKNVYGILRAPRIGSTEAIVISCPYRYPDSIHTDISHTVPLMLAFADFARKQKYWAKDIIFLMTDGEQLGMHAWLDAYHGHDKDSILHSGSLDARAGVIQAAINLEIQSFDIDFINIKLEGLNGQLPNLDLVNLVQKLANREGLPCGYKMTNTKRHTATQSRRRNLEKMWSMVFTQATGVPTGNHGLYHRYGIEAVTLEGVSRKGGKTTNPSILPLLKMVEGITRSLNNLLEKFHQSFFFYVIVAHDRFISIGDYMPCIGLMGGALLIKAFIHWVESAHNNAKAREAVKEAEDSGDTKKKQVVEGQSQSVDLIRIGTILITSHALGFLIMYLPSIRILNDWVASYGIVTETQLFAECAIVSIVGVLLGSFLTVKTQFEVQLLHIAGLLELGTVLIVIGMLNFSLGFLLCLISVPIALNLKEVGDRLGSLKRLALILVHPLVLCSILVLGLTATQYPELEPYDLAKRSLSAVMNAITFSVLDSIIYSNWLFNIISIAFLPIWIIFWIVLANSNLPNAVKLKTQ